MERQERKIIVDIDNTLWNLAPVLWEHLKAINPKMPEPSEWSYWDFWEEIRNNERPLPGPKKYPHAAR